MKNHKTKRLRASRYIMGALPTSERHRHHGGLRCGFVKVDGNALVPRYRARWASPLDLYRDKRIIDRAQHQAGLRFGRAYHHAVSSDLACHERGRLFNTSGQTADMSDSPLMRALDYVKQAYAALSSDTVHIVIDVCAYDRPAASPVALGKLRKGLDHLAAEWGMASTELCHRRKS